MKFRIFAASAAVAAVCGWGCSETTTQALGQDSGGGEDSGADVDFSEDAVSVGVDTSTLR